MIGERIVVSRNKARRIYRIFHEWTGSGIGYEDSKEKLLGIYRKTKVFCSNPLCCGNPRKLFGPKLSEKRQLLVFDEWEREGGVHD